LKKILAIGLLLVLVFQLVGGYILFKIWQRQMKTQAKQQILAGLPPQSLNLLIISPSQQKTLEWEDEREFRYQGNWYDVVRTETHDSLTYYYCYLDTQETQLITQFSYLLDLEAFSQRNFPQATKNIFKKIIEEPAYFYLWQYALAQVLGQVSYFNYTSQLSDNQLVINSPPPELFV
jgi:hypothetical protein